MASRGVSVTHDIESADIAITEQCSDEAEQFAADGGVLVHVPGSDGRMTGGGPFDYHRVPERESWIEAAGFLYSGSPLLEDLCVDRRLGWAFEGLYPFAVATGLDPDSDVIHAGYVQGWLANWGSPLVTRSFGDGSITALTFRLRDDYADHPVATLVVDRLLARLADGG